MNMGCITLRGLMLMTLSLWPGEIMSLMALMAFFFENFGPTVISSVCVEPSLLPMNQACAIRPGFSRLNFCMSAIRGSTVSIRLQCWLTAEGVLKYGEQCLDLSTSRGWRTTRPAPRGSCAWTLRGCWTGTGPGRRWLAVWEFCEWLCRLFEWLCWLLEWLCWLFEWLCEFLSLHPCQSLADTGKILNSKCCPQGCLREFCVCPHLDLVSRAQRRVWSDSTDAKRSRSRSVVCRLSWLHSVLNGSPFSFSVERHWSLSILSWSEFNMALAAFFKCLTLSFFISTDLIFNYKVNQFLLCRFGL